MKNFKKIFFLTAILFTSLFGFAQAESPSVHLIVRDGADIVFDNSVPLQAPGMIELAGHPLDADSVLSVLNDADLTSETFSITDLQYYDSMGSFYLKCINSKCDYWQYVVADVYPGIGMDKKILSGGEEVYVYFSPQHKISLSSAAITTADTLTVTAQNYAYRTDTWGPLSGVTIGVTQPNPNDPFSPTEVTIVPTDAGGLASFSGLLAGSYNVGIKEDFYFPTEALTVSEYVAPPEIHIGGGPAPKIPKIAFDTNKAFEFLVSQQKEDGSFGEELYTDWATLALMNTEKYQANKIKLIKYYTSVPTKGELLTDYERRAMALMALGLNPYNTNSENYIKKIADSFDGTQFGDKTEVNDDIFALIVLQNAGYKTDDMMIQKTIDFILAQQKADGSWDNSADMTSAAIQSLTSALGPQPAPKALAGLEKAKEFLKEKQKTDGSWENVSSTAWALQGLLSLDEKIKDSTLNYLAENQDTDGGIKDPDLNNRIWQTSYVLTSLSEKNWVEIMQKFEKMNEEITPKKEIQKIVKTPVVKKEVIKKETTAENKIEDTTQTASALNALESINENKEIKEESKFKKTLMKILNFIF